MQHNVHAPVSFTRLTAMLRRCSHVHPRCVITFNDTSAHKTCSGALCAFLVVWFPSVFEVTSTYLCAPSESKLDARPLQARQTQYSQPVTICCRMLLYDSF